MSGPQIISRGNSLGGITGIFENIGGATGLRDGRTTAKVLTSDGTKLSFSVANADARVSAEEVTRRFGSNGSRVVASTLEGSDQPDIISRYGSDGSLTGIAVPMKGRDDRYVVLSGQDMERFMAADPLLGAVAANGLRQPAAEDAEAEAETTADAGAGAAQDAPEADGSADVAVIAVATGATADTGATDSGPTGIRQIEVPPSAYATDVEVAGTTGDAVTETGVATDSPSAVTGTPGRSVSGTLTVHANDGSAMQRYETADGGHVYIFSDGTNMTAALYVPEGAMGNTGTYYDASQLAGIEGVRLADGRVLSDGSVQTVANAVSGGTVDVAAAQTSWARNSFGANATPEAYAASMERNQTFAQRMGIDVDDIRSDPDAVSLGSVGGEAQVTGAETGGTELEAETTRPQTVPGMTWA